MVLSIVRLMEAGIVPAEVLVPPEACSRGFRRDDAALVIDGYLRRLAAQEACCRVVLGRLARAFLRGRGQHLLGFARLGDYARETDMLPAERRCRARLRRQPRRRVTS